MKKMKCLCKKICDSVLISLVSALTCKKREGLPHGTALVIAPHPDDETLACGATIAQLRAKEQKVRIVVISDGASSTPQENQTTDQLRDVRRKETTQAAKILGVEESNLVFLSYPDGRLDEHTSKITQDLRAQIDLCQPSLILAPHELDGHLDHKTIGQIVRHLPKTCPVFSYVVWIPTKHWLSFLKHFILHEQQIKIEAGQHLETKKAAISAYESQTGGKNYERDKGFLEPAFVASFLKPVEVFFERKEP